MTYVAFRIGGGSAADGAAGGRTVLKTNLEGRQREIR